MAALERKASLRKVIKLDLASMLDDATLAGDRQLSALQADRGEAISVLSGPFKVDPGFTLAAGPLAALRNFPAKLS